MFSKISRYRKEPDDVTVDARGRVLESKSLRLLPEVSGKFLHTIEEGERLDHLAYKYYKQPRSWWRIVDANPAFLSPQALVGSEPRARVQIGLSWNGTEPPWTDLLQALLQEPGVEAVGMGTSDQPFAEVEILAGLPAFDLAPALAAALDASARAQQLTPPLRAALLAEGLVFSADLRLEKPDVVTWRITDRESLDIFTFQLFEDEALIRLFENTIRYNWVVMLTYDTATLAEGDLLTLIEGRGFEAELPRVVGRVGKAIVIPSRPI